MLEFWPLFLSTSVAAVLGGWIVHEYERGGWLPALCGWAAALLAATGVTWLIAGSSRFVERLPLVAAVFGAAALAPAGLVPSVLRRRRRQLSE